MKTTSIKFKCKCEFKTKLVFKRPHAVEPTVTQFECKECKSRWLVKFFKNTEPNTVRSQSKLTYVSPVLEQLLAEEAEHLAKPIEDEVAENEV